MKMKKNKFDLNSKLTNRKDDARLVLLSRKNVNKRSSRVKRSFVPNTPIDKNAKKTLTMGMSYRKDFQLCPNLVTLVKKHKTTCYENEILEHKDMSDLNLVIYGDSYIQQWIKENDRINGIPNTQIIISSQKSVLDIFLSVEEYLETSCNMLLMFPFFNEICNFVTHMSHRANRRLVEDQALVWVQMIHHFQKKWTQKCPKLRVIWCLPHITTDNAGIIKQQEAIAIDTIRFMKEQLQHNIINTVFDHVFEQFGNKSYMARIAYLVESTIDHMQFLNQDSFLKVTNDSLVPTYKKQGVIKYGNDTQYSKIIIIGDSRIEYTFKNMDWPKNMKNCEPHIFCKTFLTLDQITDFIGLNIDDHMMENALIICSVGSWNIFNSFSIPHCTCPDHVKEMHSLIFNIFDEDTLSCLIVDELKFQKLRLRDLCAKNNCDIVFTNILSVGVIEHFQNFMDKHLDNECKVIKRYGRSMSSLTKKEDMANQVISKLNEEIVVSGLDCVEINSPPCVLSFRTIDKHNMHKDFDCLNFFSDSAANYIDSYIKICQKYFAFERQVRIPLEEETYAGERYLSLSPEHYSLVPESRYPPLEDELHMGEPSYEAIRDMPPGSPNMYARLRPSISPLRSHGHRSMSANRFNRSRSRSIHRNDRRISPRASRSPRRNMRIKESQDRMNRGHRGSRSPTHLNRRPSRSPNRNHNTRSPFQRFDRSNRSPEMHPHKRIQRSRSPKRKSPPRKVTGSPHRRPSRSPHRRLNSSHRNILSPNRRNSRTPKRARSPPRQKSRSPRGRNNRSPPKRISRTPIRQSYKSPPKKSARSSKRASQSPSQFVNKKVSISPSRISKSPNRGIKSPAAEKKLLVPPKYANVLSKPDSKSSEKKLKPKESSPSSSLIIEDRQQMESRSTGASKRVSISPHRVILPGGNVSRSPNRKTLSSPQRRSPHRRTSRSPHRRTSRSPHRRTSRSPNRRTSRSPNRRTSRSPHRKTSRSPHRRTSRSPHRRTSRSPHRRISRSPHRRISRSPHRRISRSPHRRTSRSPHRITSRSPLRRISRSPHRTTRSPFQRRLLSPSRSSGRKSRSPIRSRDPKPFRKSRSPRYKSPTMRRRSRSYDRFRSRSRSPKDMNWNESNYRHSSPNRKLPDECNPFLDNRDHSNFQFNKQNQEPRAFEPPPHPNMGPHHSDMGRHPNMGPPHPNMGPPHSNMGPHPNMGPPSANMGPSHPNMGPPHPNMGPPHPNMGPPHPNMGPPHPNMGPPHPNMGPPHPNMGPHHPNMGPPHPNMGPPHPNMGPPHPNMGPPHPNMGPPHLNMGPLHPNMGPPYTNMGPHHPGIDSTYQNMGPPPPLDMGTQQNMSFPPPAVNLHIPPPNMVPPPSMVPPPNIYAPAQSVPKSDSKKESEIFSKEDYYDPQISPVKEKEKSNSKKGNSKKSNSEIDFPHSNPSNPNFRTPSPPPKRRETKTTKAKSSKSKFEEEPRRCTFPIISSSEQIFPSASNMKEKTKSGSIHPFQGTSDREESRKEEDKNLETKKDFGSSQRSEHRNRHVFDGPRSPNELPASDPEVSSTSTGDSILIYETIENLKDVASQMPEFTGLINAHHQKLHNAFNKGKNLVEEVGKDEMDFFRKIQIKLQDNMNKNDRSIPLKIVFEDISNKLSKLVDILQKKNNFLDVKAIASATFGQPFHMIVDYIRGKIAECSGENEDFDVLNICYEVQEQHANMQSFIARL